MHYRIVYILIIHVHFIRNQLKKLDEHTQSQGKDTTPKFP